MQTAPFQVKRRIHRTLAVTGSVLAALLILMIGRFLFLERFLVYREDGVYLDFSGRLVNDYPARIVTPVREFPLVSEPLNPDATAPGEGLAKLSGVYVTAEMLRDIPAVRAALAGRSGAVMLDVKTHAGSFLYTTGISDTAASKINRPAMDALISELSADPSCYLIARLPAFSDSTYALAHQTDGLPISGGALWMDAEGTYALDPASTVTQRYLIEIAEELNRLGFDEVLFDNFSFPTSANIVYAGDRAAAVADAAQSLSELLTLSGITVSFAGGDFAVSKCSARIVLPLDDGGEIATISETYASILEDPAAELVFLTASHDTRFSPFGMLAPLFDSAQ